MGVTPCMHSVDCILNMTTRYVAGVECHPTDHWGRWCDLCAAVSNDGFNWTLLKGQNGTGVDLEDAVQPGPADSYVQILPQRSGGRMLITRYEFSTGQGPRDFNFKWRGARGVRLLYNPSANLVSSAGRWQVARRFYLDLQYGAHLEHLRRQLYTMTVTMYADVYYALITVLEWPKEMSTTPGADSERIYLATSRDGLNYDLRWIYAGVPLVTPGKKGSFDFGTNKQASQFVTHQDQHWLYYKGCPHGHESRPAKGKADCEIGLVRFRLDSLAHLVPKDQSQWASVTTKAFRMEGQHLEINAEMKSSNGKLLVAIIDTTNDMPFQNFSCRDAVPITSDGTHVRTYFQQGSNLSALRGLIVRLQFHFFDASLHAFQFL